MESKRLEKYITCGICFELFNEDNRRPRILHCGHTYCHSCLEKILTQSPCCPTCKAEIHMKNANLIPVNFNTKSMISEVGSINAVESQCSQLQAMSLNSGCDKFASEGLCSEHNNFKELRCMDCRTLLVREACKEMKGKATLKIDNELETRKSTLWSLESLRDHGLEEPLYAVYNENEPFYGLVQVIDNQIWISCFQKEKPNSRVIPIRNIISGFEGISELPKKVFLQLIPEGEPIEVIDVVIQTDEESLRAKNFILLCSGLKRYNYKGLPIKYIHNRLGNSFYQLDPGPPPVVEGMDYDSFITQKEGFVNGMDEGDSWFRIGLKNSIYGSASTSPYYSNKIGVVVSGLQELKEFQGDLIIKETGFVI